MKIVGTLDVKDDGDLLKAVLDDCQGLDAILAYNDDSSDTTEAILDRHPKITSYVNRRDYLPSEVASVPQHRRVALLNWAKKEFHTFRTEEIWVVRLEGDRFLMNTSYREFVEQGARSGLMGLAGAMVECRIGPNEDWKKLDSYPYWHKPIQVLQDWGCIDDVHPLVAFRLTDDVHYTKPRPWPTIKGLTDYTTNDKVWPHHPLFAHHGRRSPTYWSKAFGPNGTRTRSKKWPKEWDFSTPETAYKTVHGGSFRPKDLLQLSVNPDGSYPKDSLMYELLRSMWNSHPTRQT